MKSISNLELVKRTKELVGEERRVLAEILRCLRETEHRRLYAELGYSSMYDYCRRELGYCEGSAHRRIAAMRLMRDIPEVEQAIESGALTLTTAAQVQDFARREKITTEEKRELAQKVENKSKRETEAFLMTLAPQAPRPEMQRTLSEELTEYRFSADQELSEKISRLKSLTGKSELAAALSEALDLALVQLEKPSKPRFTSPERSHTTPAERAFIKQRDGFRCQWPGCVEQVHLDVDHIRPVGKGGLTTPENLRTLCRAHNAYAAAREYGIEKMKKYSG